MVAARTRKATFNLDGDVLAALDDAVAKGAARSKNAFVDRALRRELRELRRQSLAEAWRQAAQDPQFMKDVQEIEEAFAAADVETARRIG